MLLYNLFLTLLSPRLTNLMKSVNYLPVLHLRALILFTETYQGSATPLRNPAFSSALLFTQTECDVSSSMTTAGQGLLNLEGLGGTDLQFSSNLN